MGDISSSAAVILLVLGLLLVAFIVFISRGGRLKSLDLGFLGKLLHLGVDYDTDYDKRFLQDESDEIACADDCDDLAHGIIRWLQEEEPENVRGRYIVTGTTEENKKTAANLYSKISGKIIGTCFFENPYYGDQGDFASLISEGSSFIRLTTSEVCNAATKKQVQKVFAEISCKARIAVIPEDIEVSKIGGIFCCLQDESYIVFLALNNSRNRSANRGLVFSGTIAQELFSYFEGFAKDYGA